MKLNPILEEDYGVTVPKRLLDALEDRDELADIILLSRAQKRGDVPAPLLEEAFSTLHKSARKVMEFPDSFMPDTRIDEVVPAKQRDWMLGNCCGWRTKNMAGCGEYGVLFLLMASNVCFLIDQVVRGRVVQGGNVGAGVWVSVFLIVALLGSGVLISRIIVRRRHRRLFGHVQTLGEVAHSSLLWHIKSFSNRQMLRDRIDKSPSVLDKAAFSDLAEALHVLFAVPKDRITEETRLAGLIPKADRGTYPLLLAETLGIRVPPASKLRRRTVGETAEIILALNRGRFVQKTGADPDNDVIQSLNWAFRFKRIRL